MTRTWTATAATATATSDSGDGTDGDGDMDMDDDMDMDMSGPGGIPLASGADDRDGLEMDVLHVPLGPVLPLWPAGLQLTCTLAGDVVTGAAVQVLPARAEGQAAGQPAAGAPPAPQHPAAERADLAHRVLALAGREDLAHRARAVRTAVLAGDPSAELAWSRLARRVRRSRLLRWSLRDLGRLDQQLLADHRLPARLAGDVHDRLLTALGTPVADGAGPAEAGWRARLLGLLPQLVAGGDVAAARLLVASLPADLTLPASTVALGARHG